MTQDLDLATLPERFRGVHDVATRLFAAGIHEAMSGDVNPPITRYVLGDEDGGGLYAEFLIPRTGAGVLRNGKRNITGTVGGATAQKLPYLDLLMVDPWAVTLDEAHGYPLGSPGVTLQVTNPMSYLAQKLLVLDKRSTLEKKGKDVLYLYDTLLLFVGAQTRLKEVLPSLLEHMHPSWHQELQRLASQRFKRVDDPIRQASLIAGDTGRPAPPAPELIARVCDTGLRILFGGP